MVRSVTLCGLALLPFINLLAQGTWTQKANFAGTARYGASSFSIGGYGYVGLGYDGSNYQNDFWQYDPSGNVWTQKATFTGTSRHGASCFVINGKAYVGTGLNGSTRFADLYEYDPTLNLWSIKTPFPGTGRYDAAGFSVSGLGYIGTGTWGPSGPMYNDFYEYDPVANNWTQRANFPGAIRNGARGISIGNKGYLGTGSNVTISTCYADWYEYDPSSNTWTQKANFPGAGRAGTAMFTLCNKGYVGTGIHYSNMTPYTDFYAYDPVANTWATVAGLPGAGRGWTVGFEIGGKGYVSTGYTGTFYNDLWELTSGGAVASVNPAASTICSGQSVTLTASGGNTYSWFTGATTSSIIVSPSQSTTYSVVAVGGCGSDTAAALIQISVVALDPGLDGTICAGDSMQLSGGGNATTYTWSPASSVNNPYASNPMAFPTISTTYTVIGSNAFGCIAVDSQVVTVNPIPVTPTITVNGNTLVSSPAVSYQWYSGTVALSGEINQSFTATQSGSYYVQITNSNGCQAVSLPVNLVFNGLSDFQESAGVISLSYENSSGILTVMLDDSGVSLGEVSIYNAMGQLLFVKKEAIAGRTPLRYYLDFVPGIYYCIWKTAHTLGTNQFVIGYR